MDYSATNVQLWNAIIQVGIISGMLLLSNVLRHKIPFIKKTLMPTSVLAGFLLLGLKYLDVINIDVRFLEMVTYHGIALGFIALSLRVPKKEKVPGAVRTAINSGACIVSTYLVQGVTGIIISLLLSYTFMPDLFKASGLLLPMGFGQGPGQANNIGSTYEALGFTGGRSYGLAIAAAGFLVACVGGVIYLNIQVKKGKLKIMDAEEISGSVTVETFQDENEIQISQSIDKLSIQVAFILLVYAFTYFVLWGITSLLSAKAPGVAKTISPLLWGFNFIFGSLFAILLRVIVSMLRKSKIMTRQHQNNYLLSRISGLCFDVMIIAGIASINFEDLRGLWIPFLITCAAGAAVTFIYLNFICARIYPEYRQEAFLAMFGMLTGTISSGILLVREVDPNFETPAAGNLVSGSGTGIAFGAPILILVGLGAKSTAMLYTVLGIILVYLAVLLVVMFAGRKNRKTVK